MCIDAPESTTNSLSSGLRVDGAGKHPFSEGEKKAVLCFSLNFRIFLASFHPASRAHRSCHSVSSWDRSSNFGALGLRWWSITWANHSNRWILVSNVSMTQQGFSESNTSNWLQYVWALPQNRCGLRRLHVLNTQPICRVIFNIATALLSPFFLDLLQGYSSTWRCAQEHFSQICIHSRTCRKASWRMPFFSQNKLVQIPLK